MRFLTRMINLGANGVKKVITQLGCNVRSATQVMSLYQENISMCGGTTCCLRVLLLNVLGTVALRMVGYQQGMSFAQSVSWAMFMQFFSHLSFKWILN